MGEHGGVISRRAILGKNAPVIWDELDPAPLRKPRQRRRLIIKLGELFVLLVMVAANVALLLATADYDLSYRYAAAPSNAGVEFASIAGEYRLGARRGRGWCLSILPDGRYSLLCSSCTGVGDRESGSVKRVGEYFVLSTANTTDDQRMARVFRPVEWDCRTYMIPVEKFPEFIEAIVQVDEPRIGPGKFYVKNLDQPVTGIPDLPQAWAERLRNRLVIGTVVEMLPGGRARIDRGTADGILAGSELTVQRSDRYSNNRKLKVVAVDERSCTVQHFYHKQYQVPLEVGWKVVAAPAARHAPQR